MMIKLFITVLLLVFSVSAHATIQVFACEPEWKALVEELGGDKVDVFSATTAFQDPHHIEARPSLIAKMRKAELLVCTGSGLEDAWLDLLVRQSGNKHISQDSVNYFMASNHVDRLEVPQKVDRSMGDIHGQGNPHVHLSPVALAKIARILSERLIKIDESNAEYFREQYIQFDSEWQKSIRLWEAKAQGLSNKKVIVYHRTWSYLLDWLNMSEVADLEPKPGIPPTMAHLNKLLEVVEAEKPDFILISAYQSDKSARWLSQRTNVPVLTLPYTVGGNSESSDLFGLFESTLSILLGEDSE